MATGISFISCSHRPHRAKICGASIARAVGDGLKYEFIVIDNRKKDHDIFSAYAKGAELAKFDIFGFVHDDVELLSNAHWVEGFLRLMTKKTTGIVGVAGSKDLKPEGAWWDAVNRRSGAVVHTDGRSVWPSSFGPYGRVAVVDGALFFVRRDVFQAVGGYEKPLLTGFHFYDIDISARTYWAGYKNYTVDLMIKHLSIGEPADAWRENRRQWVQAHLAKLPIYLD